MKKYMYITSLLFILACGTKKQEKENVHQGNSGNTVTLTAQQEKNADLRIEVPEQKSGSFYITAKGEITTPPQNHVSVNAALGGYVKQIHLQIGDKVSKGQTLMVLEDIQFIQLQQDYLTGKTRLAQLKNEYDRQETLSKSQASSQKQAEMARADYENQLIAVKAAREKLRLMGINADALEIDKLSSSWAIKSTVNGYVTAVNINMGKYITPTETLLEVVDPSDMHLSLKIFEKDVPYVDVGQEVEAYTNSRPEKIHKAKIIIVGKTVLPDKSVEIHAHFEELSPELIPGLFMNAQIRTHPSKQAAVPSDAVMEENGKSFIFVQIDNGSFEFIRVEKQWTENDSTGITHTDGSPIVEKVVTKNAYTLYMQLRNKSEQSCYIKNKSRH